MAPLAESDQPYCSAMGTIATEMDALSIEHISDTRADSATTTLQSVVLSSCGVSCETKFSAAQSKLHSSFKTMVCDYPCIR